MKVEVIKKKDFFSYNNEDNENNRKIRVAAYARVSTDHDEQQTSFESQQKYYFEKISNEPNWSFVEVYADEGISGTQTLKRENFLRMIKDAEDGKIDMILTKSISRFARNTVDTLKYVRLLKAKNVSILFEEENILTTDMPGELLLTVLSSVAQQEIETMSSHIRLGFKMKAERGEMIGFNRVYGYDCNMKENKLTINESEAKIVRMIFKLYLEGYGCNRIATTLNEMGIVSPRGKKKWGYTTINKILHNEKYIGDVEMGKTYTLDPISHKRRINNGEEDKFYVKNHHEPIISHEDFNKIQEMFTIKHSSTSFRRIPINKNYTFTGKFRCAYCGETYIKKTSYRNKTAWACKSFIKIGRYICPNSKVAYESILKNVFVEGINLLLNKNEFDVDEFVKEVSNVLDVDKTSIKLKKLQNEKFELDSKMSKLIDLLLEKKIDNETFDKKRNSYLNQITEITNKIEKYSSNVNDNKNEERIFEIKDKILSDLSSEDNLINSFDPKLFEELVLYGIIGGYTKDGELDPYMIRFIIKSDINTKVNDDMVSDIIVTNNQVDDEDNLFKPILDFESNQKFYSFEQIENKNTKILHNSIRVRFEVENI